jgi:hypothetical protein
VHLVGFYYKKLVTLPSVAGIRLQSMTANPVHKKWKQFNRAKVRLAHYDVDQAVKIQGTLFKVTTTGFIA